MAQYNNTKLMIQDFAIMVGTVNQPELIGVDDVDPLSRFTGDPLGYVSTGDFNFTVARTYADARSRVPGILVRRDLTQKDISVAGGLLQVADADLWEFMFGFSVQKGHVINIPAAKVIDLAHFGPDEGKCISTPEAFLFVGQDVACRPFYIMLYNAANNPDSANLQADGTNHSKGLFNLSCFPHPDVADNTKSFGSLWEEVA